MNEKPRKDTLGWMRVLLQETAEQPATGEQMRGRLAQDPKFRGLGAPSDLLGGLRFLCNVGFVTESNKKFEITALGRKRLAAFGMR